MCVHMHLTLNFFLHNSNKGNQLVNHSVKFTVKYMTSHACYEYFKIMHVK